MQRAPIYFSALNLAEIEIKVALGKMERPAPDPIAAARAQGWAELPLAAKHASAVKRLPLYHRDPFDRLLLAQALTEDTTLVSRDQAFELYDVRVLPC